MTSQLIALANLISSCANTLESAYAKNGLHFPSLDDTPVSSPALTADPTLEGAKQYIIAAAEQIIATVQSPNDTLGSSAASMHKSSTLGFLVDVNVPDILKEAGSKGLHVNDISARCGIDDPSVISRILRFHATRHIFKEVSPNVFANNRISSYLVKAKSLDEIKADPKSKYDGSEIPARVSHIADEALKCSAHLSTFLQNPGSTKPFNIAFDTDAHMWQWFEEPENEMRARRFATCMKVPDDLCPSETFTTGLKGIALNADDVVVDVGGSVGSVTLTMYKAFPHLRYIVQDLEKPISEANNFWNKQAPEAITSGRVQFQVHDFFNPQPVQDAAVYFMRVVIHDWPDLEATKIMKNLRAAACRSSKLILFDFLILYACEDPNSVADTGVTKAPYPLLPNIGVSGAGYVSLMDMQMMTLFNGKERTIDEFKQLGEASGWKLDHVQLGPIATLVYSAS